MLSPSELSESNVDKHVMNEGNNLGIFERKDLKRFQAWGKENDSKWTFHFSPSRVDSRVGIIRAMPMDEKGEKIMRKSHIRDLRVAFKWMPEHKAVALVDLLEENERMRYPIIRNVVIRAAKHQIIRDHMKREAIDGPSDPILSALLLQTRTLVRPMKAHAVKRELSTFRLMWDDVVEILDRPNRPNKSKPKVPKKAKGFDSVEPVEELPTLGVVEQDEVEVSVVETPAIESSVDEVPVEEPETSVETPASTDSEVETPVSKVDEELTELFSESTED